MSTLKAHNEASGALLSVRLEVPLTGPIKVTYDELKAIAGAPFDCLDVLCTVSAMAWRHGKYPPSVCKLKVRQEQSFMLEPGDSLTFEATGYSAGKAWLTPVPSRNIQQQSSNG